MHSLLCLLFFLPTVASNCYEFQIPSTDGTKCFTIFEGELTYDQAQTQCAQVNSGQTPLGGTAMAAVHNLTDNDVLLGIANGRSFWLGGTNKHSGNTWNWVDRSKFDFKNWAAGQPGKAKNRCLLVDGVTGLWKAVDCGTTAVFVCQSNSVIYAPDGPPSTSCPEKTVCREGFAYVATSAVFTSWDDAEKYCLAKYKGIWLQSTIERQSLL
ncbi:hypothetical protein L596_010888 [Steinernema carpocapsae]|uniref:C-type lectin domain-containing protein n=1 Tax=Steinernema carpocapsae TaxID=34508 RepID=A0A4U5PMC4_STECR|nr:hypothetical protein L596_010888 [Steinernema carpocapsae]